MNIADPTLCQWSPAPYLIISDNIWGNFIYYSHLFPSITALVIALLVFWQNPRGRVNQALLFLASTFTLWSLIDLVLWASERSDLIMFFWSILIHFDLLIYASAFYFIYAFVKDQWPKWWHDLLLLILFVPLVLFAHTPLNLTAFDFTNCWREALEGPLWQYYVYNAELLIVVAIIFFGILEWHRAKVTTKRSEIIFATVGIIAFLLSFSFGNITGSLETDWELGQYGLFGMPVFVAFLTFLIVRYQSFNVKLIATEALVAGLGVLILSLLFVRKLEDVSAIATATLILTVVLGVLLVRSVRREVKQREELERLTKQLRGANKRLRELDRLKSEFVSVASHQLRSPLTSIRGYASLLLDGTYGKLPPKAKDAIERIGESSRFMALSIEDYLNVSRIQSGSMKYNLTDVNLKETAFTIADDLRPEATRRGLVLKASSDLTSKGIVQADRGKLRQIVQNLIDNAMKYTPKGTITVRVYESKRPKRIHVDVKDTGIGMSEETLDTVFDKFERAHNANDINVTGTGLGLFIARKMAEDMGGSVEAISPGEGKGSTFTITLPLQM